MKPRFSMRIPNKYQNEIRDLIDFYYYDFSYSTDSLRTDKPIWYDFSKRADKFDHLTNDQLDAELIIVPGSMDVKEHVKLALEANMKLQARGYKGKIGFVVHLSMPSYHLLKHAGMYGVLSDVRWLPAYFNMLKPHEDLIHTEYRTLDYLRCTPHMALVSDLPVMGATLGQDIVKYERKPKKRLPFDPEVRLTDHQLELALNNIKAIKEAQDWHEHRLDTKCAAD